MSVRRRSMPREQPPEEAAPSKLALLVGINYTDAGADAEYPPLRRAQKDTKDFRELLIGAFPSLLRAVYEVLRHVAPQTSTGTFPRTS